MRVIQFDVFFSANFADGFGRGLRLHFLRVLVFVMPLSGQLP